MSNFIKYFTVLSYFILLALVFVYVWNTFSADYLLLVVLFGISLLDILRRVVLNEFRYENTEK